MLGYAGDDAETARSVAQHISFANPEYLTREDVPAESVEKERAIVEQISRDEGKPEAALPKIIEGRLGAYFKQVALLEQDYAKDNKLSVAKVLSDAGLTVTRLRSLQGRRVSRREGVRIARAIRTPFLCADVASRASAATPRTRHPEPAAPCRVNH